VQAQLDSARLLKDLSVLAHDSMEGRATGQPGAHEARAFLAAGLAEAGLEPAYPSLVHPFGWGGAVGENVVAIAPGQAGRDGPVIVLTAHYDHLGIRDGQIYNGADDNASGVAALLVAAAELAGGPRPARPVVFVAFTGEEAGRKGSKYYVQNEKYYPASRATGMINLDTVGRLGKGKLVILGAGSAKEWSSLFEEAARPLKLEIAVSMQDLDSSDQKSFQEAGVPAVQLFTGPHADYHRPTDTADKIDGKGLVKVATAARSVVFSLANRPEPLTATIPSSPAGVPAPRTDRKVTLGIIPDFTYNEQGVRLGGTQPDGPAERAGLRTGDVVIQAGGVPIAVLKDLSDVLKLKQPGDKLTVKFLRNGNETNVNVELKER
jgi:hypothetical protein